MLGALQLEVKGKLQTLAVHAIHVGQRRMHAIGQQAIGAAGGKRQIAAIEAQLEVVLDAANVADADRQKSRFEAVVGEIFRDAVLRRQLEVTADLVIAVIQPRLVDAALALFGEHIAIELKLLRQKIQPAAQLAFFQIAHPGFLVGFPFPHCLAVRHHQKRAG